jgi:23S rRNA (uracil1939-C5)-methyltransferase
MLPKIEIDSLSSTGEGVGSLDGMKVFVEGALPGETVQIKIHQRKKTYATANLIEILTHSCKRIQPVCSLFGSCGGCQLMHLNYSSQIEAKKERVAEALKRIGGLQACEVLPCLPSPVTLGYRNKIQLPIVWENGKKRIGLYRKNTHEIIPVNQCLIQCPQGNKILSFISEKLTNPSVYHILIRSAIFLDETHIIFVTTGQCSKELKLFAEELLEDNNTIKGVIENLNTRRGNVVLGPHFRLLAGRPFIYEKLLGKTFKISPAAFFQINPAQAENLYTKVLELADIQTHETVLDTYCGVGALAILASDHAHSVSGIECIPSAIADAKENAHLNGVECTFLCGRAEKLIRRFTKLDVVFLNPPRKGCDPSLIQTLMQTKPSKIIYVSCDPATLARDLALLHPSYTIDTIQPIDLFPQTMHVETVVRLSLRTQLTKS